MAQWIRLDKRYLGTGLAMRGYDFCDGFAEIYRNTLNEERMKVVAYGETYDNLSAEEVDRFFEGHIYSFCESEAHEMIKEYPWSTLEGLMDADIREAIPHTLEREEFLQEYMVLYILKYGKAFEVNKKEV